MKKLLGTILFLTIVLSGTVLPVGEINKAYAEFDNTNTGEYIDDDDHDVANLFRTGLIMPTGAVSGGYVDPNPFKLKPEGIPTYVLQNFIIKINQTNDAGAPLKATDAIIKINFALRPDTAASKGLAKDISAIGTKKNFFDKDDDFGVWSEILDSDIENTTENGLFLRMWKVKENAKTKRLEELTTTDIEYTSPQMVIDPSLNNNPAYIDKYGGTNVSNYIKKQNGRGINLGLYVWGTNPEQNFFNKDNFRLTIPIRNLEKNTRYVVRIAAIPDGQVDAHTAETLLVEFTTPATDPQNAVDANGVASNGEQSEDFVQAEAAGVWDCSLKLFGTGEDGLGMCIAKIAFGFGTSVGHGALKIAAKMLNAFVAISIGRDIYDTNNATFVYIGWKITRDIANLFFIFILLYTAIGTILGLHGVNYKKVVVNIIVIGLFMNFSLMFTRVIIDGGNILARVFYNEISLTGTPEPAITDAKEKDLSSGIIQGFNPYNLTKGITPNGLTAGVVFLLAIVLTILLLYTAWTLFISAAFFIGRIAVLWVCMVFAPFAFVSTIIPGLEKKFNQMGWHAWFKQLIDASFNAAIFMFFIYLILILTQSAFIQSLTSGLDFTLSSGAEASMLSQIIAWTVKVGVPMAIIIALLTQAKSIAKEMAGQFGDVASGAVMGAVGLAVGAGAGVASFGLKNTIGRAALNKTKDEGLKGLAAGNADSARAFGYTGNTDAEFEAWKKSEDARRFHGASKNARRDLERADKLSKSSFDIRNTGLANKLSSAAGMNMDAGALSWAGLGTGDTAGGRKGDIDRKVEKVRAFEELLKADPEKLHHLEEDKESVEKKITEEEEKKSKIDNEIRDMKDRGDDKAGTGTPERKAFEAKLQERKDAEKKISAMKNGGTVITKDPLTGATKLEVFGKKGKEEAEAAGYKEGTDFTLENSKKDIEKDIKEEQKGRIRDYYRTLKAEAGLGNMRGMGAGFWANLQGDFRNGIRGLFLGQRGLLRTVGGTVLSGIVGGAFAGLPGMVAGGVAGGLSGIIRTLQINAWTMRSAGKDIASLAENHHYKTKQWKSEYKSPNKSLFDMFSGLGSSGGHGGGGHGGGHDDHGHGGDHGHDDHGGGHH